MSNAVKDRIIDKNELYFEISEELGVSIHDVKEICEMIPLLLEEFIQSDELSGSFRIKYLGKFSKP